LAILEGSIEVLNGWATKIWAQLIQLLLNDVVLA